MQRVAEIIYIIPEEREKYLERCLNPDAETSQILWLHGIRNQYYFSLNQFILMTFEYVGNDFYKDMAAITAFPSIKQRMVSARRKDVPVSELETSNWWAPVKRLGSILTQNPMPNDTEEELSLEEQYHAMLSGHTIPSSDENDISFSEDDWSESIHF